MTPEDEKLDLGDSHALKRADEKRLAEIRERREASKRDKWFFEAASHEVDLLLSIIDDLKQENERLRAERDAPLKLWRHPITDAVVGNSKCPGEGWEEVELNGPEPWLLS